MALVKCAECGKDISSEAPACPGCGKPQSMATNVSPPQPALSNTRLGCGSFISIIIALVLVFALIAEYSGNTTPHPNSKPQETSTPAEAPAITPPSPSTEPDEHAMPADERKFLRIVQAGQMGAETVSNDMQLGGLKAQRDRAICAAFTHHTASNWVGLVKNVDSNSDGMGVFVVSIGSDITVGTWNIALADITDHTLIKPNDPVFTAASNMSPGEQVYFSGSFIETDPDSGCIEEKSLTLRGKMRSPDFVFRFSSVSTMPAGVAQDKSKMPSNLAAESGSTAMIAAGSASTATHASAAPRVSEDGVETVASARVATRAAPNIAPSRDAAEMPPVTGVGPSETTQSTVAPANSGPSFNCVNAHSTAEQLICEDSELSSLDRDLASLYLTARAAATDKMAFLRENRDALRRRESLCTDKACLLAWYAQRRQELRAVLAGKGPQAASENPSWDIP